MEVSVVNGVRLGVGPEKSFTGPTQPTHLAKKEPGLSDNARRMLMRVGLEPTPLS
jgi:hypothetical protein